MNSRAGFAAIIGAPNAGKSTLTNALVGEKVSIVTHKVQTTRFQVRGIAMLKTAAEEDTQVVLVDTPGIFAPKETDRLAGTLMRLFMLLTRQHIIATKTGRGALKTAFLLKILSALLQV